MIEVENKPKIVLKASNDEEVVVEGKIAVSKELIELLQKELKLNGKDFIEYTLPVLIPTFEAAEAATDDEIISVVSDRVWDKWDIESMRILKYLDPDELIEEAQSQGAELKDYIDENLEPSKFVFSSLEKDIEIKNLYDQQKYELLCDIFYSLNLEQIQSLVK